MMRRFLIIKKLHKLSYILFFRDIFLSWEKWHELSSWRWNWGSIVNAVFNDFFIIMSPLLKEYKQKCIAVARVISEFVMDMVICNFNKLLMTNVDIWTNTFVLNEVSVFFTCSLRWKQEIYYHTQSVGEKMIREKGYRRKTKYEIIIT